MSATSTRLRLALPVAQAIAALSSEQRDRVFQRGRVLDADVVRSVAAIIASVRSRGDAALRELARRYDGVDLDALEVPRSQWQRALQRLDPEVRNALEDAAHAITAFHRTQLVQPTELEVGRGVKLGRRAEPLRSVGVYVPGGRAAYPSSVLMGVVPARVAGVGCVVVASPPGADGLPHPGVLAACALTGADRVFALGGAGAIAAFALSTASVPRVDKLIGPGNAYVTEAKRQLTGLVAIDGFAGPSEILVLADASADPQLIALELLAQAEHDPDAACVLACSSLRVIEAVAHALERQLVDAPRKDIITTALARNGALLLAEHDAELLSFAEQYAPEHLLILTREPRQTLEGVRAAGTVFLGAGSSVAFGDYTSGANHVLPTGGWARTSAGLSVSDFQRVFTYQEISGAAAATLARPTAVLADAEGLPAHAQAARYRAAGLSVTTVPAVLRSAYAQVELYDPQRAPCDVDLSDNTNLFGMAPGAARALANLPPARVTRYPAVFASPLKEALAARYGVAAENVVTGCGSDDVIDSALRAFCEPGDRVVFPEPTFGMVSTFARMNAVVPAGVPLTPDLQLDIPQLIESRGRVTYICRPNNPTGTVFPAADVARIAAMVPGILLVDEAYADFAGDDLVRYAAQSERVVSLRTFSKAFGLAGLRLGFAIGPAPLVHEIEKSRGPYKVSGVAETAALAVLQEDARWIQDGIRVVRQNRERLRAALLERGIQCPASGGNFLLIALPTGQPAAPLAAGLRRRGVAVRPFPGLPHLGDCVRVTIGPWPMLERFLDAFDAL
jgi:histidinol dehydrogenase